CSERDVVVGEVLAEIGLRRRRGLAPLGRGAALLRAILALAALAAALASTAEHLHLVGDDVGEVLLDPVLAGELVVADRAFDVDLAALAQVLAGDLAQLPEQLHPVPLGALLGVAVLVLAHRGRGQRQGADGHAALGVLHVGVVAEVSDQDHFVHAAGHWLSFRCRPGSGRGHWIIAAGRAPSAGAPAPRRRCPDERLRRHIIRGRPTTDPAWTTPPPRGRRTPGRPGSAPRSTCPPSRPWRPGTWRGWTRWSAGGWPPTWCSSTRWPSTSSPPAASACARCCCCSRPPPAASAMPVATASAPTRTSWPRSSNSSTRPPCCTTTLWTSPTCAAAAAPPTRCGATRPACWSATSCIRAASSSWSSWTRWRSSGSSPTPPTASPKAKCCSCCTCATRTPTRTPTCG